MTPWPTSCPSRQKFVAYSQENEYLNWRQISLGLLRTRSNIYIPPEAIARDASRSVHTASRKWREAPQAPTKFRTGIIHVTDGGAIGARQRKKKFVDPLLLKNLPPQKSPTFSFNSSFSFLSPNHNSFINNNLSQWVSPTLFLRLALLVSPLWFFLLVVRIANTVCPSVANNYFANRSYVVG